MNDFLIDIFDVAFEGTQDLNPTLMAMIPFFVLIGLYVVGYIGSIVIKAIKRRKK